MILGSMACFFLFYKRRYCASLISGDAETKNNSNLGLLGLFRMTAPVEHVAGKTDPSEGISPTLDVCSDTLSL